MTITHGTIEIVSILKLLHLCDSKPIHTNIFNYLFITSLHELLDLTEDIKVRTNFKKIYALIFEIMPYSFSMFQETFISRELIHYVEPTCFVKMEIYFAFTLFLNLLNTIYIQIEI